MSASLLGVVIEDQIAAAGRVGDSSVYLYRENELFPFFETVAPENEDVINEGFVGANSLVSVELASVPVQANDVLLAFSRSLSVQKEKLLKSTLFNKNFKLDCQLILEKVFTSDNEPDYLIVANLGPETLYLKEIV